MFKMILEKAHELGELIKNSPEMKAMDEADEAQKNDKEAQELLQEFNLKRMNIARDMQAGKIQQAEAIVYLFFRIFCIKHGLWISKYNDRAI